MSIYDFTEVLALSAKSVVLLYLSACMFMVSLWLMYQFLKFPLDVFVMCWRKRDRVDAFLFGEKRKPD